MIASYPVHTALKLITAPTIAVLSLADAKTAVRIDGDTENGDVRRWIATATGIVEGDTDRALLTQTWDLFLDRFPYFGPLVIPKPPLASVTAIYSTDTDGAETTWSTSNYVVDTASTPGRIGLTDSGSWPSDLRVFQPGRVRFVAGWTSAALVPDQLVHAVALLVGFFAENRGDELVAADRLAAGERPPGYQACIGRYQLVAVG